MYALYVCILGAALVTDIVAAFVGLVRTGAVWVSSILGVSALLSMGAVLAVGPTVGSCVLVGLPIAALAWWVRRSNRRQQASS